MCLFEGLFLFLCFLLSCMYSWQSLLLLVCVVVLCFVVALCLCVFVADLLCCAVWGRGCFVVFLLFVACVCSWHCVFAFCLGCCSCVCLTQHML